MQFFTYYPLFIEHESLCYMLLWNYWWLITGFLTRVTRRVPHVEQELFILSGHSTWVHPRFLVGSCYSIISFMCMFCWSLFVLLSFSFGHCVVCPFFLLAIVLSVLRFTTSNYIPLYYLQTCLDRYKKKCKLGEFVLSCLEM